MDNFVYQCRLLDRNAPEVAFGGRVTWLCPVDFDHQWNEHGSSPENGG